MTTDIWELVNLKSENSKIVPEQYLILVVFDIKIHKTPLKRDWTMYNDEYEQVSFSKTLAEAPANLTSYVNTR